MSGSNVRLVVNPNSGHGRGAQLISAIGPASGVEVVPTRTVEDLVAQVQAGVLRGDRRILVAGGDGTVHQAIQHLAGTSTALGIVSCGSGNDLARSLGLPLEGVPAMERALSGTPRRIDLGRIGDRRFVGAAGIGLNSEVARCANTRVRWVRGRWIYPYAVIRALLGFHAAPTTLESIDGNERYEGAPMLVLLANTPYLGGGMLAAPDAEVDDGRLDAIVLERMSRLGLLLIALPKVYSGRHMGLRKVRSFRVADAILTTHRTMPIYADGEPIAESGPTGISIRTEPGALSVLT